MKKLLLTIIFSLVLSALVAQTRPHITDIRPVENIAALRAIKPAEEGTWAFVEGYASRGDGGGGDFYWSSTSVATDNLGTIIMPNNHTGSGRWLRQTNTGSDVRVEWFGAFPDSGLDESERIQRAINFANGERLVKFPAGTFLIGKTLEAPAIGGNNYQAIYLQGNSPANVDVSAARVKVTQLRGLNTIALQSVNIFPGVATNSRVIIDLTPGAADYPSTRATFIDSIFFTSEYVSGDPFTHIAIQTKDFRETLIQNCYFNRVNIGINVDGYGYYSLIKNCGFARNTFGISSVGNWNNSSIENCRFHTNIQAAVFAFSDEGPVLSACFFEASVGAAVQVVESRRAIIQNSYFEGNQAELFKMNSPPASLNSAAIMKFSGNVVKIAGNRVGPLIRGGSSPESPASAAASQSLIIYLDSNFFENTGDGETVELLGPYYNGSEYCPKFAVLIGNQYRFPRKFNLDLLGAEPYQQYVNRMFDGPGNVFRFGRSFSSPSTGITDALDPREEIKQGMLRFDPVANKFQGVASETIGWFNLH
jgi:hypothetical protein